MGTLTNPHVSDTRQLFVLSRFRDSNFEIPIITARIPQNEHACFKTYSVQHESAEIQAQTWHIHFLFGKTLTLFTNLDAA